METGLAAGFIFGESRQSRKKRIGNMDMHLFSRFGLPSRSIAVFSPPLPSGRYSRSPSPLVLPCLLLALLPFWPFLFWGCDTPLQGEAETEKPKSVEALVPQNNPDPEKKRIDWMGHWLHENLREKLVREIGEEYRFEHPEIELNLKFPQEIVGIRSKPLVAEYIADMVRSGDIRWDIVWMDDRIYVETARLLADPEWGRKHLVDFEQVPGFVETQKPFIVSKPQYRNQTGGLLVGPYIEGYLYALWYNKPLADRMGLGIKERAMTFDDLLGYVEAVDRYNAKSIEPVAAFYEAADWFSLEILFQNLVKSEFDNAYEADSPENPERKRAALFKAMQAFERLSAYAPLIPSHNENIWFETRRLVLEDHALFYVNGTWMYSHWRGIDPEKTKKMVPAELPVFQETSHALGGYIPTWAVMKKAPGRDAAIDFLLWWSKPKVAEKWVRYTKNPTGLRGNLDHPTLSSDIYERFQADMTGKYHSRLSYCADAGYVLGKEKSGLASDLNDLLRGILAGKISARDAYDNILERCGAEVR